MASSILKIAAPLALSYFAPGIGTALGSTLSAPTLGAIGGGAGGLLSGGGLKGAALGALGGYGLQGGFDGVLGSLGTEIQGPLQQGAESLGVGGRSGILGSIGEVTGLNSGSFPSIGGLTGSSGGGSTFSNLGSIAKLAGGYADDEALKKAQEQLLAGNNQQLQNLQSFDPSGITQDPGYEFQRAQGEQGLNRSLGAQGNLFSGRALQAASEYNNNYANNAFNDYYKRWADTTNAQNNIYGSSANTQAAGGIARANNIGDTLTGVLDPASQGLTIEQLRKLGMAV